MTIPWEKVTFQQPFPNAGVYWPGHAEGVRGRFVPEEDIIALTEENDRLRHALEVYAEKENWRHEEEHPSMKIENRTSQPDSPWVIAMEVLNEKL